MKIGYVTIDTELGVAYIALGDKKRDERRGLVVQSREVNQGVVLDFDKEGNLVGVEVY